MEPQASTSPERSTLDEFLGRQPSSQRMRQLRRAAPVVGLLLLAGLAALYFTGRSSDQPNYATTPVQRGDLRVTVSATGNLQPTNEVEVGSELSGLVTEVNVDNNDRVNARTGPGANRHRAVAGLHRTEPGVAAVGHRQRRAGRSHGAADAGIARAIR